MTTPPPRTALLAAVQQSPDAVAVHDRESWLDLYSVDGQVNDPVGSRPHTGREAIGRFYETFIAPNKIVFFVDNDIVDGMTVVRDLTVQTTMSTGVVLRVPMHLRYDVVDENGVLKISRLYAHWELPSMIGQLAKAGVAGIGASAKLAPQLLSNQGVGGALGFVRGFRRVGRRGKRAAEAFLEAVRRGDIEEASGIAGAVELPGGQTQPTAEFVAGTTALSWSKTIASGKTVTVTLERNGIRGVALFGFGARANQVATVRVFTN